MDIALIGYGKMGKAIEEIAIERGHQITLKISQANQNAFTESNLKTADIAIEFTQPHAATDNIINCFKSGIPVVCGTTGWTEQMEIIKEKCNEFDGGFLYASNFSIGVNVFFEINRKLAQLMNQYADYEVDIEEIHHIEKIDKPSGTAISLAKQILGNIERKEEWTLNSSNPSPNQIPINAFRLDDVKGTHIVKYSSDIDDVEIKHTAHSRRGFALGAVLAAEFLHNKKGIYTMKDVLVTD